MAARAWTYLTTVGLSARLSAVGLPLKNAYSTHLSLHSRCRCGYATGLSRIMHRESRHRLFGRPRTFCFGASTVDCAEESNDGTNHVSGDSKSSGVSELHGKMDDKSNKIKESSDLDTLNKINESPDFYRLPIHDPTPETRADEFDRLPLKCNSCGSYMQTENADYSGYITPKKLPSLLKNSFEELICSNCHSVKYKNKKVLMSVNKDNIMRQFQHLTTTRALILYIVDVTDLHGSLFPDLLEVIGRKKRILIVGNKVDMLAADDKPRKQEINIKKIVENQCLTEEMKDANIRDVCLVSGKTGYGIEKLVVLINKYRHKDMDLYIVGSSNVGKSAIFNMLQNLSCISKDAEIPTQAISHYLPGTTLGLVRHPIAFWRMSKVRRMLLEKPNESEENDEQKLEFVEEVVDEVAGKKRAKDDKNLSTGVIPSKDANFDRYEFVDPSNKEQEKCWMYDTPGLLNTEQITQFLTPEELKFLKQNLWIVPKTFILKPGGTLLIGGLARIDFCEIARPSRDNPLEQDDIPKASQSVYLTVFCSNNIVAHPTNMGKASDVLTRHFGDNVLKIPFGDDERRLQFPPLQPREHEVTGAGWDISCADLAIAGLGWIAVTAGKEARVKLQLHTPNGIGQQLRHECLMPYSVTKRGKRGFRHLGNTSKIMYECTRKQNPQLISNFEKQDEIIKEWLKKIEEKQKVQRFQRKEERRKLLLEQGIVGRMRQLVEDVELIELEASKAKLIGPGEN